MIADFVMLLHNVFQFVAWATCLYLIVSYLNTGSPPCWRECILIAQYEQCFEILAAALGLTKSNPVSVAQQVGTKAAVCYFILPLVWHDQDSIKYVLMCAIPWCIGECIRYPYYQIKAL